ncbi:unnamed protein product, partial [Urochloa humidicola]
GSRAIGQRRRRAAGSSAPGSRPGASGGPGAGARPGAAPGAASGSPGPGARPAAAPRLQAGERRSVAALLAVLQSGRAGKLDCAAERSPSEVDEAWVRRRG